MIKIDFPSKNSILFRILLIFLIILIPLYMLGMNIFNWGVRTVRTQIADSMLSQVDFYLSSLETEIQRINILQLDCLNDENLNQLAVFSERIDRYSYFQAMAYLQQRLNAIKNSSNYILDVSAHIPKLNKTIHASTSYTNIPEEEYKMLKKNCLTATQSIMYWKNRLIMGIAFPVPGFFQYKEPSFIISIELSQKAFLKDMNQFSDQPNSGSFLTYLAQNFVIFDSKEVEIDRRILGDVNSHLNNNLARGTFTTNVKGKPYLVIYAKSNVLGMMLARYIPEDRVFEPLKTFRFWFVVFTFAALIIIFLFTLYSYKFIHKPLFKMVNSFRKVENGDLSISIEHKHNDEFRYLFKSFNAMVHNLNLVIDQAYRQKILMQRAELKQLQSQINPHFLYNSFFIISTMCQTKQYDNLELFAGQMGEYFQFITRSACDDIVLHKEVSHARVYTEIQAARFGNRIFVEFDTPPEEFLQFEVPRLIIQPLVENAFKHSLEKKAKEGHIRISFLTAKNLLQIIVEDNGEALPKDQLEHIQTILRSEASGAETTGIINIHRRLQLKFGSDSGLEIMQGELGGLKVVVNIKMLGG